MRPCPEPNPVAVVASSHIGVTLKDRECNVTPVAISRYSAGSQTRRAARSFTDAGGHLPNSPHRAVNRSASVAAPATGQEPGGAASSSRARRVIRVASSLNFLAAALVVAGVFWGQMAIAAPPPGADPDSRIAQWVRSLHDYRGVPCCSTSDCRRVALRLDDDGGVEVFIDRESFGESAPDRWVAVSDEVVAGTKADGPSPDAGSWACWYAGKVACVWIGGGM